MLVGAAADRWDVEPAECDTADGFVIHGGKRLAFGELAEEAADRSRRAAARCGRSAAAAIGQPLPRLDLPAKIDGSLRFAGDVRLART